MDDKSNMVKVIELLMEIEENSEENDGGGEYFIAEDGLKHDNYSFDGDWSDAFNDSYYSPTKDYSADWYTPAWVTDDDYSIGKSFYDNRDSYSTYSKDLFNYDYNYWDDPIYDYTPSYDYGYDYLDSKDSYTSDYFDYDYTPHTSPSYDYTPSYDYDSYDYDSYDSYDYNEYTDDTCYSYYCY